MTRELPPLINATYNANGVNAVGDCPVPAARPSTTPSRPRRSPGRRLLQRLPVTVGSGVGPAGRHHPRIRRSQRREHVGTAGRSDVGVSRPVEECREAGRSGDLCGRGRRRSRRRRPPAAGLRTEYNRRVHRGIVAASTKRFADAGGRRDSVTYVVRPQGSHTWGCSSRRCRSPGTQPLGRPSAPSPQYVTDSTAWQTGAVFSRLSALAAALVIGDHRRPRTRRAHRSARDADGRRPAADLSRARSGGPGERPGDQPARCRDERTAVGRPHRLQLGGRPLTGSSSPIPTGSTPPGLTVGARHCRTARASTTSASCPRSSNDSAAITASPGHVFVTGMSRAPSWPIAWSASAPTWSPRSRRWPEHWVPPPPCAPSQPVSVMAVHGTADPVVPYGGGPMNGRGGPSDIVSAPALVERWREMDRCPGPLVSALRRPARCSR